MRVSLVYGIGIAICAVLLATPGEVNAERINDFTADVQVQDDASVIVTETIAYDFGTDKRHGIFREIPYVYSRSGSTYELDISVLSVTDGSGTVVPFTRSYRGTTFTLQIGDPDKTVTGVRTYIVRYGVQWAINYFEEHDELYWNVTGNGWEHVISSVAARVTVPDGAPAGELRSACFTGPAGSTAANCEAVVTDSSVSFNATEALSTGEGLTVVVGWPKGLVYEPSRWVRTQKFLLENFWVVLPFVGFGVMLFLWFTRGRDPRGRGTVIPQYEPPDGLRAAEVGALQDGAVHTRDVSAAIVQLAVMGYLKIRAGEQAGSVFSQTDYDFIKLRESDGKLRTYERELLEELFKSKDVRSVSSLKNSFYRTLPSIKSRLYEQLVSRGYYRRSPATVKGLYVTLATIFVIFSVMLCIGFVGTVGGLIAGVVGVGTIVLAWLMPQPTVRGAEAVEHIQGFRWFLSVTETDRLKFHNAPEKKPETFEQFLPYAMVLKVENEWAKQFENIYTAPPQWYEGGRTGAFNAVLFAGAMNAMSSDLNSAMASAPSSGGAGSGGSGFSGGSSGGGFGGGGGGSW